MLSLKLSIDLVAGGSTGVTVGVMAPSFLPHWPLSFTSLVICFISGLFLGYVYYKNADT